MQSKTIHFDQWLIITVIVVMCAQLSVGSMIQKSYMRFLGTLVGSLLAALTLTLFGTEFIAVALTIALSALFFSYVATSQKSYSDAGTLGAVTTTIILLSPNPTILIAAERFFEISVGILLAALISQFILPVHARTHLRLLQSTTFHKLRTYYLAMLLSNQNEDNTENYVELDESLVKALIAQRKLATDAAREPLKSKFNLTNFKQSLLCEKEILRCITFMHHVYKLSPDTKKIFSQMEIVIHFHDVICQALETISAYLKQKKSPAKLIVILPSLSSIARISIQRATEKEMTYVHSYLFCAEILLQRLNQVISLINQRQGYAQSSDHEE